MARLLEKYKTEVVPALFEELETKNPMAVPRLQKIVISMGIGAATQDKKRIDMASKDLGTITGQKPQVCLARKSVSNFKVRMDYPTGAKVTLRGRRMYEFLDRLISVAIPRIRDFRGLNPQSFDGRGNYSMGISEQTIFPEIDPAAVEWAQGMNVTMVTTAKNDRECRALLKLLGMPFRTEGDAAKAGKTEVDFKTRPR
jgi:large subunit ribosomal protein L5